MSMRRTILTAAAVAAALCAAGCFKKVSYDTELVIKPLVQHETGAVPETVPGAVAYAFGVDTALWTVASYADALEGVLTAREGGERYTTPLARTEPFVRDGTENWISMRLSTPSALLLVVDTQNRLYGYCQYKFAENLPQTFISTVFRPWKQAKFYVDGAWRMYNEFYEPEPEPEPGPDPENPGGGAEPPAGGEEA